MHSTNIYCKPVIIAENGLGTGDVVMNKAEI